MSYPFYLGESLSGAAASRDASAFTDLVQRNFEVIMNTHSQPLGMRKLRVAQLQGLIIRAAYRAGAHPERLFARSMDVLDETRRLAMRQRHEVKAALLRFAVDALNLIPDSNQAPPDLFHRFIDLVQAGTDGRRTVGDAARHLNVSPSHLSRIVKQTSGHSPGECMRIARLERARELLASLSVTEAAFDTGFGKVSSFISLFRKHYGETPGTFKRRIMGTQPSAAIKGAQRSLVPEVKTTIRHAADEMF
jgi:AraC-like DNA-binding protein